MNSLHVTNAKIQQLKIQKKKKTLLQSDTPGLDSQSVNPA